MKNKLEAEEVVKLKLVIDDTKSIGGDSKKESF